MKKSVINSFLVNNLRCLLSPSIINIVLHNYFVPHIVSTATVFIILKGLQLPFLPVSAQLSV